MKLNLQKCYLKRCKNSMRERERKELKMEKLEEILMDLQQRYKLLRIYALFDPFMNLL